MTRTPAPPPHVAALRHYQHRLVFGGGGLLTALLLLSAMAAAWMGLDQFNQDQRRKFFEARQAIDGFLVQRDRAYAGNINGSDTLWASQQAALIAQGTPLAEQFTRNGGELAVLAAGEHAVPWLVVGRSAQPLPAPQLAAYLGMLRHYSAYPAATIVALESSTPSIAMGYTPDGALLAVAGLTSENQLLRALNVSNREALFARLTSARQAARAQLAFPAVTASTVRSHRLTSFMGINPITGRPSLVSHTLLAVGDGPYFHRVTFEPIDGLRQRLEASVPGRFVVTTGAGQEILQTGSDHDAPAVKAARDLAAGDRIRVHWRAGHFVIAAPVQGIDWVIVHSYGWSAIAADQGKYWAGIALATALIVAVLWAVLLGLQRRVLAPALDHAERVFESEALTRTIVDTSPVGLGLLGRQSGEMFLQNHAMQQLADHRAAQQQPLPTLLAQRLRSVATETAYDTQLDRQATQGKVHQLQVTGVPARFRGKPVWVVALRDISSQVELEAHLRSARRSAEQARQAAEAANRAKTAFIAATSHEIRTPLNGVLGHLELLTRTPLQPDQRTRVERIRQSAETLHAMVSDALDFSRIEAGLMDVDLAPFQLRTLLEQTALLFAPLAHARGVALHLQVGAGLAAQHRSDAHRLQQILNNLVNNAVKFTHKGQIVLRVSTEDGNDSGPCLRFDVEDTGVGIDPTQQARLFQPFTQADAGIMRVYGGSGLGLALCQQLAQLLGGRIALESAPQAGSVFSLVVPMDPVHASTEGRPLHGRQLAVVGGVPLWRVDTETLLLDWGAQLVPAGAADTLIVLGDAPAPSSSGCAVVRLLPEGPLAAEPHGAELWVSRYASQALLAALQPGDGRSSAEEPAPLYECPVGQRGRVLLVEDNLINRELIQQQLQALGFDVVTAMDGHQGLHCWAADTFDAVLTDLNMPDMDGYALVERLRNDGAHVPILVITASALAGERQRCQEAGVTDLLSKPLTLHHLDQTLRRYLPERSERRGAMLGIGLDSSVMAQMRQAFIQVGERDLAQLREAMADADLTGIMRAVHSFAGALSMLDEHDLAQRCKAIEAQLTATPTPLPVQDIQTLVEALAQAVGHFKQTCTL